MPRLNKSAIIRLMSRAGLVAIFAMAFFVISAGPALAANPNTPTKYDNVTADGSVNPTDIEFFCEFRSSAEVFCWRNAIANESNDLKEGEKSYWFDPQLSANAEHDVFRPDDGATTDAYGWLHFPNSASGDYSTVVVSTLPIAESKTITADQGVSDNDVGGQDNHDKAPEDSGICNIEMFAKGDKAISCDVGDDPIRSVSNITYKSGFDSYVEVKKCDKGGLGFVLCPIQEALIDVVKQLNEWLIELLDINTNSLNNQDLRDASQSLLNIANAFYAIIFLIIIFANGLSIGLDSYALKKMVPRLVAAIILSQFAFFITGAFIELGNVLGATISAFFLQLSSAAAAGTAGGAAAAATLTATAVAGALVVFVAITMIIIIIISILIVLAVLAIRLAGLYVLVLVAPLAFAAKVLPNTEKLFKTWSTNLVKLVMMYPIIMAITSGSAFIGTVMTSSSNAATIQIIGALVPFIGFLMVPKAFKWSGGLMAATGGKLASWGAKQGKSAAKDKWSKEGGLKDQIDKRSGGRIPTSLGPISSLGKKEALKRTGRAQARIKNEEESWTKGLNDGQLGDIARGNSKLAEPAKKVLKKKLSEEVDKQESRAAKGLLPDYKAINEKAAQLGYIPMPAADANGDRDYGSTVAAAPLVDASGADTDYGKVVRKINDARAAHAAGPGPTPPAGGPGTPPAPPAGPGRPPAGPGPTPPAGGPGTPPAPPAGPGRPPAGPAGPVLTVNHGAPMPGDSFE
jgi:hypothetical protein